jgi:hypothetical protein
MKRYLLVLPVFALLPGCSTAFAKEQPWSFVASVGGLQVGVPMHSHGRWSLPIQADVSGAQAITTKPTTFNSAIVCTAVDAKVQGPDIMLVVRTTLAHGGATSVCPAAKLGKLANGSYNVWYGTSRAKGISLGTVRVAL